MKSSIPRSTLSNWKKRDISRIIGCDPLSEHDISVIKELAKSKKLLQAAKALYYLFNTISTLFQRAENKAELLRDNKLIILTTIERVKGILGIRRIVKSMGLTPARMYYWLEKLNCQKSAFQLCQKRHPNQLLPSEVNTIKRYLLDDKFKNWSTLSIYYQALRDKEVFMGLGTWYKYAKRLGIKAKFFHRFRKGEPGIRASRPLKILHMDVTIYRALDHSKIYIYFIVDNFSRTILNWQASMKYSSSIALEVLKAAIIKYNITKETTLITDGGPENHGDVSGFITGDQNINHKIAQSDIIQSNSMVEAVNKHIKYYYLFRHNLHDLSETISYLSTSVDDYNHKPHGKLYGYTPMRYSMELSLKRIHFKRI